MSNKTDQNLPPEVELRLEKLNKIEKLFNSFLDIKEYPTGEVMHCLGSSIISVLRDESFRNIPEFEENAELLHMFYYDTFRLLQFRAAIEGQ